MGEEEDEAEEQSGDATVPTMSGEGREKTGVEQAAAVRGDGRQGGGWLNSGPGGQRRRDEGRRRGCNFRAHLAPMLLVRPPLLRIVMQSQLWVFIEDSLVDSLRSLRDRMPIVAIANQTMQREGEARLSRETGGESFDHG